MTTAAKIFLSTGAFLSLGTVAISDAMLKSRFEGYSGFYPLFVIPAVGYLHWFTWSAFIPLKLVTEPERKNLIEKMKRQYSAGTFAGCVGLGYFLVSLYVFDWFGGPDRASGRFFNPVWAGLAFIVVGLFSRLHGLLRFLLLERK